ncbi:Solute carrier family 25 member 44 isoform A, partial [Glycine soja]
RERERERERERRVRILFLPYINTKGSFLSFFSFVSFFLPSFFFASLLFDIRNLQLQAIHAMASSEINWDRLDKKKFFVVGAGLFTGVTVALYPVSVVKTRLQVASKDTLERSVFSVVKGLLKTDGIPGLYKGFGTVITGAIPTRIIFLTALETTKVASFRMVEPFRLSETNQAAIANGIAGMASSFLAQSLFVPIDVVSQKLMVQGYSGHAQYSGGLDVARKVLRSDGIRGLYRGFGLSVMTYVPSNAVWWASYGSSQRYLWRFLGDNNEEDTPSLPKIIFAQATGGIIAGATASCITTPLDTIKTRLQVMGLEKKISVKQVVKDLITEDGWKGVYRGLGPRFFSMSAWGTSMILAYEYLKRLCAKDGGGN